MPPFIEKLQRRQKIKKTGFGLFEIVVAITVGVIAAVPLLWMVSSTRMETTKAINYLRALELANEVIDLANVVPFDKIEGATGVYNGILNSAGIPVKQLPNGHEWTTFVSDQNILYPDQYGIAYFYRDIKVEPITTRDYKRFLKKVKVSVEWNEARIPPNPNDNQGQNARMRKIILETLVFNDMEPEY